MRIAFIGNLTNVHMRRWAGHFAGLGHDVHVITTIQATQEQASGLTVHFLGAPRTSIPLASTLLVAASLPRQAVRLRRLLQAIGPDVVHVHYLNEAAVWAVIAGAKPLVVTAWGSDIVVSTERSWARRRAVEYVLHMRERLLQLGTPASRAEIIFFGTDVKKYSPAARSDEIRAKFAPNGESLIISTRSLEPIYDIPTLLRSIPLLLRKHPRTVVLIGGTGSLAESLHALARDLGVEQAVRFIGRQDQSALPGLYASADVYVSTALSDGGIAASTAEAMACETPVVITDVEDNAQWVQDGTSGLLVPPKNPEALASAVGRLLSNPTERSAFGKAARRVIVERNSVDGEMGRMESLYRNPVCASRCPGAPSRDDPHRRAPSNRKDPWCRSACDRIGGDLLQLGAPFDVPSRGHRSAVGVSPTGHSYLFGDRAACRALRNRQTGGVLVDTGFRDDRHRRHVSAALSDIR
jgi:L-malate glycosyltransferase